MVEESSLDKVVRLSRHVKTPAGVKKYGKPVGSPIGGSSMPETTSAHWGPAHKVDPADAPSVQDSLSKDYKPGNYSPGAPARKASVVDSNHPYPGATDKLRAALLETDAAYAKNVSGFDPVGYDTQTLNRWREHYQAKHDAATPAMKIQHKLKLDVIDAELESRRTAEHKKKLTG